METKDNIDWIDIEINGAPSRYATTMIYFYTKIVESCGVPKRMMGYSHYSIEERHPEPKNY
jgi:hypothetical protein